MDDGDEVELGAGVMVELVGGEVDVDNIVLVELDGGGVSPP